MKLKVIVYEAPEGGYSAEVPAIPGCITEGDSFEELLQNLYDAVEGCLAVAAEDVRVEENARIAAISIQNLDM